MKKDIVGAEVVGEEGLILSISELGYGKPTNLTDYRLTNRGVKNVINMKTTRKTGNVLSVFSGTWCETRLAAPWPAYFWLRTPRSYRVARHRRYGNNQRERTKTSCEFLWFFTIYKSRSRS